MCQTCGYEEILSLWRVRIRSQSRYAWALDTIISLCVWIKEHEHITERQRRALASIHDRALNPPLRLQKGVEQHG